MDPQKLPCVLPASDPQTPSLLGCCPAQKPSWPFPRDTSPLWPAVPTLTLTCPGWHFLLPTAPASWGCKNFHCGPRLEAAPTPLCVPYTGHCPQCFARTLVPLPSAALHVHPRTHCPCHCGHLHSMLDSLQASGKAAVPFPVVPELPRVARGQDGGMPQAGIVPCLGSTSTKHYLFLLPCPPSSGLTDFRL